ncbi:efflux RND transporter periplasmic adaptor subunit [Aneurinibacillus terranovensis]|uniref:efflux RND transporter periplasmic adaptor subunit n=1 Tax=Aneurinibacillus terranovensis TaxID=278991 RepID=UPI0004209ABA|nr:efflux RND transporter periplasmic adaptor subunit [Aneurinibacillus terranovensis]
MRKGMVLSSALWMTAAVFFLPACSAKPTAAKKNSQAIPVVTSVVKVGNLTDQVILNGQCSPALLTKVTSKQSGKVSQVYVQMGDVVHVGQPLIQLDTSDLQIQLEQQQAALQVAQAQAEKAKVEAQRSFTQSNNSWSKEKAAAYSTLNQEKANVADAQSKLNQDQALYAEGAIPKQDVDNAALTLKNAQTRYEAAQKQYQVALADQTPYDQESINVAEAQVTQAQASVDSTKHLIQEMSITSPVNGIVVSRDVEVGGFSGTQGSVVTIAQLNPIKINVNVPESLIDKIRTGSAVSMTIPAINQQRMQGTIARINPVEDSTTKTYNVEVDVQNNNQQIKPGMVAQVTVGGLQPRQAIVIPANALIQTPDGPKVFTVENNVAHQHLVKIGVMKPDVVEIKDGIHTGDVLVTQGQDFLSEGKTVEITGPGKQDQHTKAGKSGRKKSAQGDQSQ